MFYTYCVGIDDVYQGFVTSQIKDTAKSTCAIGYGTYHFLGEDAVHTGDAQKGVGG